MVSEETESYDEHEMDNSKSVARRSNAAGHHVVCSSDDGNLTIFYLLFYNFMLIFS